MHTQVFTRALRYTLGLGLLAATAAHAQQTVGGSVAPGSTLDVKGSVAASYLQVTATSYTLLATDFYVVYANNSASGTITLPAANSNTISTSSTNYKGRLYQLRTSPPPRP